MTDVSFVINPIKAREKCLWVIAVTFLGFRCLQHGGRVIERLESHVLATLNFDHMDRLGIEALCGHVYVYKNRVTRLIKLNGVNFEFGPHLANGRKDTRLDSSGPYVGSGIG